MLIFDRAEPLLLSWYLCKTTMISWAYLIILCPKFHNFWSASIPLLLFLTSLPTFHLLSISLVLISLTVLVYLVFFRVLKAKHSAHARTHLAEECRSDYAAQLQKYNKEQNNFYYADITQIYNVRPAYTSPSPHHVQCHSQSWNTGKLESSCPVMEMTWTVVLILFMCVPCFYDSLHQCGLGVVQCGWLFLCFVNKQIRERVGINIWVKLN